MRSAANNPSENVLGPNANKERVIHALEQSGYPLQGRIARELIGRLEIVIPEWGFVDEETGTHRSLDLFGWKQIAGSDEVDATLILLIECKRSDLPYVFFRDIVHTRQVRGFPKACGSAATVQVHQERGNNVLSQPTPKAFGLEDHPFISSSGPICSSFSRAEPAGKDGFRLSGASPFRKIILPLARATDHAERLYKDAGRDRLLRPFVVVPIAVLEAPMLVVEKPEEPGDPTLAPWVRVRRQEARSKRGYEPYARYGVDVVHSAFFREYVAEHLLPYADELGQKLRSNAGILRFGAEADALDNIDWGQLTVHPSKTGG